MGIGGGGRCPLTQLFDENENEPEIGDFRLIMVIFIGTQQLKLRDCDSIHSIPNSTMTMHSL